MLNSLLSELQSFAGHSPQFLAQRYASAAGRGVPHAQYALGVVTALGHGVPQNLEDAFFWLCVAARSGKPDYARLRDRLGELLPVKHLAAASRRAEIWEPEAAT